MGTTFAVQMTIDSNIFYKFNFSPYFKATSRILVAIP